MRRHFKQTENIFHRCKFFSFIHTMCQERKHANVIRLPNKTKFIFFKATTMKMWTVTPHSQTYKFNISFYMLHTSLKWVFALATCLREWSAYKTLCVYINIVICSFFFFHPEWYYEKAFNVFGFGIGTKQSKSLKKWRFCNLDSLNFCEIIFRKKNCLDMRLMQTART